MVQYPASRNYIYNKLKREIRITADGSTTIHISNWNESYHSRHGAIQEAYHVFVKNGLSQINADTISILEIGFGTGLNAFITFLEAKRRQIAIDYTGVEAYPISSLEVEAMNYSSELAASDFAEVYKRMHECSWEEAHTLSSNFFLTKRKQFFQDIVDQNKYDLIYFDAFGYDVQPELWTTNIFRSMHMALKAGGILVTYAARGVVKRSMLEVGFEVEKLPGPPGKREMFRATKLTEL